VELDAGDVIVTSQMRGALMVCGTTSNAGKTTVVTGLCRLLARRGIRVAPFKAQNMALNSVVTADGGEIGRAQGTQAFAAGIEPDVTMNPVLLKPTGERTSQVIVFGRPVGVMTAREYHDAKPQLLEQVLSALGDLRSRYDVVLCEGAGSPAEINLLDHDIVNPGLTYAIPYVDKIHIVPTQRLQKLEFGFSTPAATNFYQGDPQPEETETMITGDLNTALVPWVVQYRITDPKMYLFGAREPGSSRRSLSR